MPLRLYPLRASALTFALLAASSCAPAGPAGPPQADEPAASRGWSAAARSAISASEYAPRRVGDQLRATNRAQDLRAVFGADGVAVSSRTTASEVRIGLYAWGREGHAELAGSAAPEEGPCLSGGAKDAFGACLRRVDLPRAGLTEWWENRPDGLRQGFTITAPPDGEGPLVFEVAISGATVDLDGDVATLRRPGANPLVYAGLAAWDERGHALPAWMEEGEGGIRLVVDDEGALGTITVDPLLSGATWTAEADQDEASFGWAVASAGDVNGDGYGDVVIGAPTYDDGETNEGTAFVYLGSSTGLATTAAWTAESDQAGAYFGKTVAAAGDVNGDGYGDLLVGDPEYTDGAREEGRVFLYLGSATGLAPTATWTAESGQTEAGMGSAAASAGDVNGDGYGDVIVSAPGYSNGESYEGRAFVYLGSPSGLASTASWTAESDQPEAYFGSSVAAAGDVNGDGYGDVAIGANGWDGADTDAGQAVVYLGSATGLGSSASWSVEGDQASAQLGTSVAAAGDVNGDGYGDVLIGAPNEDDGSTDEGRASAYLGSSAGLATTAAWTAEGDADGAFFGAAVASAGDRNGDGYADIVVGAQGLSDAGAILVYFGSATGLATTASQTAYGDQDGALYGAAVASAGDVNGDGFGDLVVGARAYTHGESAEGRVFLYLGSASDVSASPDLNVEGDQDYAGFGDSVASAGDVNGDGFGDVLVGVRYYTSGEELEGAAFLYLGSASGLATTAAWSVESDQAYAFLGGSVAAAGDVDGDGYGDVLIGAEGYDHGSSDEGRAYLYRGSAAGLGATAAWTVESDRDGTDMGSSLASAGDVNGDGYDDVVVGADCYSNGEDCEGRAFVYLGSASGLGTTPSWTAESDQAYAYFGISVAGAGDVNGDGYADVVVGAYGYDHGESDEGRAYLYLGSASGLSASAAWTAEPNVVLARLGLSVASAGDVNGDGYSDVIVGAYSYRDSTGAVGRVYVYLGSASGLATSATSSPTGERDDGAFGASVAAAGDTNGDGYGDVIVGSFRGSVGTVVGGAAFLYLGSATGLSTVASWRDGSATDGAEYGRSAASAGDINGDGYGDVVVGSPYSLVGASYFGNTCVYYGGGGDGLPLSLGPQARQPDGTTPLPPGLASTAPDGFSVAMATARGPWGRGEVRMQVEVKPLGEAFDGTDLVETDWTDSALSGADLLADVSDLVPATGYHWRARVVYSPAEGRPQGWGRWSYGGRPGDAVGGHVFTAAGTLYEDVDGDGYGSAAVAITRGASTAGLVSEGGDCDEGDDAINPGAVELCDSADIDEDCDGLADDADASVTGQSTFYADADRDGYGGAMTGSFCDLPSGYTTASTDCDDTSAAVNPDAVELCDAADTDEDCDGLVDDADASVTGQSTFYLDADGDGYGGATTGTFCELPGGYTATSTDCDDTSAAVSPGAVEVCDAADADEDCDGLVDDADASVTGQSTFYLDADGDGYGGATTGTFCELPGGYTATSTDCDDADASVNPGAPETVGDGLDADCDGGERCQADADGDGYTDGTEVVSSDADCADAGELAAGAPVGDCDDANPAFHPGAAEADCADPADYNCDGSTGYADADGDGVVACEDCDDTDAGAFPGGTEAVGDGVDGDCDGLELCYVDADDDGYVTDTSVTVPSSNLACDGAGEADATAGDGDCDDAEATINADATEVCDGVDDDCDGTIDVGAADAGTWYADADGDGYTDPAVTTTACDAPEGYAAETEADCDDADASRSPGATDIPGDGIDQDCDGADAALDTGSDDTAPLDDTGAPDTGGAKPGGCGCGTTGWPGSAWALALLALAARRRGRAGAGVASEMRLSRGLLTSSLETPTR